MDMYEGRLSSNWWTSCNFDEYLSVVQKYIDSMLEGGITVNRRFLV